MNSLLVFPEEKCGEGRAVIRGLRAEYVARRHDLKPGLRVAVIEWHGRCGSGLVTAVSPAAIEVAELALDAEPPPRLPMQLICAVPRPQTVKKLLQLAATVGIAGLHFVRSMNGVKSYLDSKSLLPESIEEELVMGLEQARDPVPPQVRIHPYFEPFVRDVLSPLLSARGSIALLPDTAAAIRPARLQIPPATPQIVAAIGPEAGWNDHERREFGKLGFVAVSLGERMLRVETAAAVLIGQVQVLLERCALV